MRVTAGRVIADISDINAEWLTSVLRGSVLDESTSVEFWKATNIGEGIGFAGRIYRLTLEYDAPTDAPRSLIVKLATRNEKLKDLMIGRGMLFKEPRFYTELAPTINIDVPRAYYSAYDEAARELTIVLEDLGDLPNATDATLDECRTAIEGIAKVHAKWWNHPYVHSSWLTPYTDRGSREEDAAILDNAIAVAPELGVECSYLLDCMRIVRRHMLKLPDELPEQKPITLVHGDFHRNNMTFREGSMLLFDWQVLERGSPATDVVNMLMSGLEAATLRANEHSLLQSYHHVLLDEGIRDYGFRRLLADYRRAMLITSIKYFAFLDTIDFDVPGGDELIRTLISRTNQIAEDHKLMRMARLLPAIIWLLRLRAWMRRG